MAVARPEGEWSMSSGRLTSSVAPVRVRRLFLAAVICPLLIAVSCRRYEYLLTSEKKPASPAEDRAGGHDWAAAIGERLFPLIEKHDTQYAPGYREEIFRGLALGITETEVARLLGQPLLTKSFYLD